MAISKISLLNYDTDDVNYIKKYQVKVLFSDSSFKIYNYSNILVVGYIARPDKKVVWLGEQTLKIKSDNGEIIFSGLKITAGKTSIPSYVPASWVTASTSWTVNYNTYTSVDIQ